MRIVGHRGAAALRPENTMASFEYAITLGVDGLETDVRMSADGELVLIHDETVDRTTNGSGFVRDFTLEQLKQLDAGSWFAKEYADQRIPTFREFLELVQDKQLFLNVEIKDPRIIVVENVINMLNAYNIDKDNYVIASFHPEVTDYVMKQYGLHTQGFPLAYYKGERPENYEGFYSIGIGMKDLTKEFCNTLKAQNVDPWCWCPDTKDQMEYAISCGSTLVTVNDPLPALAIRNKNSEIMNLVKSFQTGCNCGKKHLTAIRDIQIASGLVDQVGEILHKNGFPSNLLLVADRNTLKAAEGICETLENYSITYKIYDNMRVAQMHHVEELEQLIKDKEIAILSVGTGSINDPCRLAAARQNKMICVFATAPSMDGFASYNAPIVANGFKFSYPAKSPEVIIGDTKILAAAPSGLKSAGFGDMIAKYVALIDWKISALLTGEYYCEKIAALTRTAADELMELADKVTNNDEYTAGKIFEALLKTGLGMSFAQNSRPASGSEHMIAHLMECVELREDLISNLHGDDVGVCTLQMLKYYNKLAERCEIETQIEIVEWEDVYRFYGEMAEDVCKLNSPHNIIDDVDAAELKRCWPEIVRIIHSVPTYDQCKAAMEAAGCKITIADIGKSEAFFAQCLKYSPYMRKRLTLLRMKDMIV